MEIYGMKQMTYCIEGQLRLKGSVVTRTTDPKSQLADMPCKATDTCATFAACRGLENVEKVMPGRSHLHQAGPEDSSA